ncbi:MOSC domain-containing protein [Arthrobacter zhaoguopingii]|uniref:MOSC domain-containing protein n=1 Tax=Arthrobacter zhaoguopingii TaxID=2681491 RepID=UPI00135ACD9F|nr:MOSC domain-containing protein [Arthrobacter zhaoguopingii]
MSQGRVLAVCLVHGLLPTRDTVGVSAIDKRAVAGPVKVHPLGLTGDLQADRKNHGGPTKAVYAYAQEDADYWCGELGRAIEPGLFGENLRLAGIDASNAVIGERWSINGVELEVTMPRIPCGNFARRLGESGWIRRFTAANRPGAYLRVMKGGSLQAGEAVAVTSRPAHGVTIAQVFGGLDAAAGERLLEAGAQELTLAPQVRRAAVQALAGA